MWFYTTDSRIMNMNLMVSVSFYTPGRIVYQQIGRTDTHSVAVNEDERLRVAHWIEDTRRGYGPPGAL